MYSESTPQPHAPPRQPDRTARRVLIEWARSAFHAAGIEVSRHRPHHLVRPDAAAAFDLMRQLRDGDVDASDAEAQFLRFCASHLHASSAQLFQDLFVLFRSGGMRNGFFVEFGAADGITHSNTWLLEREYGWSGILAEPSLHWHAALRRNRRCTVSQQCVWRSTGERLAFIESPHQELSRIAAVSSTRVPGPEQGERRYEVDTVSLTDLLVQHGAPRTIDYLSIDTEGSELDILSAFDFSRFDVRLITVEHNYQPQRGDLHALLTREGYARVLERLSQWDDWYVRKDAA